MKILHVALLLITLFIVGCSSFQYHSIEPISPKPQWEYDHTNTINMSPHNSPPRINISNQYFEWVESRKESTQNTVAKYDFVIWAAIGGVPGKVIYYREGLISNKHTVEEALKPNTFYFWSVRNTGTKKWSTYDYIIRGLSGASRESTNTHFYFRTLSE